MPIVTIQQSPRSVEMKRELANKITEAFVQAYEVSPEAVQIFFSETNHENWAKGGELAIDQK